MGSWFKILQVRDLPAFPTVVGSYPFTVVYMPLMMALIVCVRFIMSCTGVCGRIFFSVKLNCW